MSYPPPPGGDPYQQQPPGQPPYGQPPQPGFGPPAPAPTAGKATTSLILGIVSLLLCGLLAGIPAIFLGFSARKEIKQSQGRLSGDGLALGGIITGILGTLWSVVVIIMLIFGLALFGSAVNEACDDLANDDIAGNSCT